MFGALSKTKSDLEAASSSVERQLVDSINKTKANFDEKSAAAKNGFGDGLVNTIGTLEQKPWPSPSDAFRRLGPDGICLASVSPVTLFRISPDGKRQTLSSDCPFILAIDASCGYRPVVVIGQQFLFLPSSIFRPHSTLLLFPAQTSDSLGDTWGVLFGLGGIDICISLLLEDLVTVCDEIHLAKATPAEEDGGPSPVAVSVAELVDPIGGGSSLPPAAPGGGGGGRPAAAAAAASSKGAEWASYISKRGEEASRSILTSSEKIGRAAKESAQAVAKHYDQEDPFDKARRYHPKISDETQEKLKVVEDASQTVLKGSRLVLSATVLGFKKAGTVISQTAYKVATEVMPKNDSSEEPPDPNAPPSTFSEVGVVASASLTAGLTVYHSLRRAAWAVLTDTSDASVVAVRARYGDDAGLAVGTLSTATLNLGAAAVVASSLAGGAVDVALEVGIESADSFASAGDFVKGECIAWGAVDVRTPVRTWRRGFAVVRENALMSWVFEASIKEKGFRKYESVISLEDIRSAKLENETTGEAGKTTSTLVISTRDGVIRDLRFATGEKTKFWLEKLTSAMEGVGRNKLLALRPLDDKVSW